MRELINAYGAIGEEGLWKNLEIPQKVIPLLRECGVIDDHSPDDPPYPIFGLLAYLRGKPGPLYKALVDSP